MDKREYNREWRLANKEKIEAWELANKEKRKEQRIAYKKSGKRKKPSMKCDWKRRGIRCDDEWDEVYEMYSNTTNCNICDKLFVKSNDKCLDHDHHLEGYNVRGVLCKKCNHRANEIYH